MNQPKIEYADLVWNPITYFVQPSGWKNPHTVLVNSMFDLFDYLLPDDWIEAVFDACEAAPQHRYLFLTHNGERYEQVGLLRDRDNFWYGTIRTGANPSLECGASDCSNTFLLLEPVLAPIGNETLDAIEFWKWVIIGAEISGRKEKDIPKKEWIENIVASCRRAGVPVFMQSSLKNIWGGTLIREFPWEETEKRGQKNESSL